MFERDEFAALTGLSVKALRVYDERDVLRPAVVDPSSGHRSYASEQLRRAQVLGLLRQTSLALDDLRADPVDIAVLRERLAHARRLEDFALDVAERLQGSTPEHLESTTRTMPATPWVGVVRTLGTPDTRDGGEALVGQATAFEDAALELAAACPPAAPDQDVWWTTAWSAPAAPAAPSVAVLLARACDPSTQAQPGSSHRVAGSALVTGSLPRRDEVSFPSVGSGPSTDPVAEAAAGFLEILAFDAYRTARGIRDQRTASRRVTYGPTHPLAQDPGHPVTVFDVAPD